MPSSTSSTIIALSVSQENPSVNDESSPINDISSLYGDLEENDVTSYHSKENPEDLNENGISPHAEKPESINKTVYTHAVQKEFIFKPNPERRRLRSLSCADPLHPGEIVPPVKKMAIFTGMGYAWTY
jgi:hypothetical protein